MILCVAGNPSIDKLFEVDRLTVGEIHRPQRFVELPGGKGIHVAQVVTTLGADAVVTGLLGGHSGRWVAEALAAQQVRARFAQMAGETRSSLSVADRQTGRLTEFYESGVPVTAAEWKAVESIVSSLLPQASWITLAGSLPPGTPSDAYARLTELARDAGVSVALDTRGEALAHTIGERPQLVKINALEAQELLGWEVSTSETALRAAREIRARAGGAGQAAVVTLGEQGVALVDPEGREWHGFLATRGRYPVGSGDAFLAGMLIALERGDAWSDAVALGLGAAAANADVPGAGLLDPQRAITLVSLTQVHATGGTDLTE